MAPCLLSKRGNAVASTTARLQARDGLSTAATPWATVAIIMGVVLLLTLVVFVILYALKRRRQVKQQQRKEQQHLPIISRRSEVLRKWKSMTPEERAEAEELERALMIRKSLASRTTISSMSSRDSQMQFDSARSSRVQLHDHEITPTPVRRNTNGDWKEWEAQAQTESRHSALRELAMGGRAHPALAAESEDLSIPKQARLRLESHELRGSQRNTPLPVLP